MAAGLQTLASLLMLDLRCDAPQETLFGASIVDFEFLVSVCATKHMGRAEVFFWCCRISVSTQ
jgi:hypothetical protein